MGMVSKQGRRPRPTDRVHPLMPQLCAPVPTFRFPLPVAHVPCPMSQHNTTHITTHSLTLHVPIGNRMGSWASGSELGISRAAMEPKDCQ